ncbi:hypothetical protein [Bryobacter aggregatus]|uniref:hypothetical protein n=1 Tax=Bryobacter aggregatus TaxID=360054 RepID=UPI0012BAF92B|nr:hypothetical protein [Bryobacter aggregatus]
MRRILVAILISVLTLLAAQNYRLYLQDGGYHTVREHKVEGDRVRYYSVERGEWEEIPMSLVDLKKTDQELAARTESFTEERKLMAEEAAAEREIRRIVASIPEEPGMYKLDPAGKPVALKNADSALVTDKKRQALKMLSPLPIVAGKSTLEISGDSASLIYSERRPEFYLRLSKAQQFSLVQLTPKKGARIVEVIQVIPVSKERFEERKELEIFRQQLDEGLFKIWPQADLAAGEYAWIEFTEGEVNPIIWDFKIQ